MATVRPVSTFILAATIRDAPYLMSARTLEKSRIALIPSQDVRAVFDRDGDFARAIVTELAQCYRSVVKTTKDLKLRTSLERLANYLLREQKRAGGAAGFDLPDRQEAAGVASRDDGGKPQPGVQEPAGLRRTDRRGARNDRRPERTRALRKARPPDRRSCQLMSDARGASVRSLTVASDPSRTRRPGCFASGATWRLTFADTA